MYSKSNKKILRNILINLCNSKFYWDLSDFAGYVTSKIGAFSQILWKQNFSVKWKFSIK